MKTPKTEVVNVDFTPLEAALKGFKPSQQTPVRPTDYAPPSYRTDDFREVPVKEIESTTHAIDEVLRAAKDEITELERSATVVRTLYVEHTKRITEEIKQLRERVKLAIKTMDDLRTQCSAIETTKEPTNENPTHPALT